MDEYMVNKFVTDDELKAFFFKNATPDDLRPPEQWFFNTFSLGEGPVPANPGVSFGFPWMAYKDLGGVPYQTVEKASNAQQRNFQYFVYDEGGDFTVINAVLRVARRIVKEMAPFTTDDGHRCSDSKWTGISAQLPADAYSGVCRFGTARFVVSQ